MGALIDDRRARATVVAWAIGAYPALAVGAVPVARVLSEVGDLFVSDEQLVTGLLARGARSSESAVEPSLVSRLVAERRYGARLFAEVSGESPRVWLGEGVVADLVPRALTVAPEQLVIVLSPRGRVETMVGLLATGWSDRVASVVCAEDMIGYGALPSDLLDVGCRRARAVCGAGTQIALQTESLSLLEAGRSRGIT